MTIPFVSLQQNIRLFSYYNFCWRIMLRCWHDSEKNIRFRKILSKAFIYFKNQDNIIFCVFRTKIEKLIGFGCWTWPFGRRNLLNFWETLSLMWAIVKYLAPWLLISITFVKRKLSIFWCDRKKCFALPLSLWTKREVLGWVNNKVYSKINFKTKQTKKHDFGVFETF